MLKRKLNTKYFYTGCKEFCKIPDEECQLFLSVEMAVKCKFKGWQVLKNKILEIFCQVVKDGAHCQEDDGIAAILILNYY